MAFDGKLEVNAYPIRSAPSLEASIVATVATGETRQMLGEVDGWLAELVAGRFGLPPPEGALV